MMLPAVTVSPPYRFTPRYCGLLLRPLRLEPTPFLCAISASAELEVRDTDFSEVLPMSGLAAIILPPLELEDIDLGLFALAHDLGGHRGSLHQRRSRANRLTVRGEEHLVERELGAGLGVEARKPESLSLFGAELLARGPEDGVHGSLSRIVLVFRSPQS